MKYDDDESSCLNCKHGGYWPMYAGDDPRKWGTYSCHRTKRTRRFQEPRSCEKWEADDAD